MYKVRKRDGKIVNFDIEKVKGAMIKAFEAEDRESVYEALLQITKRINSGATDKVVDIVKIGENSIFH